MSSYPHGNCNPFSGPQREEEKPYSYEYSDEFGPDGQPWFTEEDEEAYLESHRASVEAHKTDPEEQKKWEKKQDAETLKEAREILKEKYGSKFVGRENSMIWQKALGYYKKFEEDRKRAEETEQKIQNLKDAIERSKIEIEALERAQVWKDVCKDKIYLAGEIVSAELSQKKIDKSMRQVQNRNRDPDWQLVRVATKSLVKDGNKAAAREIIQKYLKSHEKE